MLIADERNSFEKRKTSSQVVMNNSIILEACRSVEKVQLNAKLNAIKNQTIEPHKQNHHLVFLCVKQYGSYQFLIVSLSIRWITMIRVS